MRGTRNSGLFRCYNFRASPSDFTYQRLLLIELAPSILSADFARLGDEARAAVDAGAQLLHVDVMDGHFVPNITIGPTFCSSLRKAVSVPLDVHLMIENPDQFIGAFVDAGADWFSWLGRSSIAAYNT